ncbi:unnamed protein product, partial [marine sediment metagenome]
ATSSDPIKANTWYLRKYSSSFVQIGVTIELLLATNNFFTPAAKGIYDMLVPLVVANIKAELNSVFARVLLYGELTNGEYAVERGFEYLIQDNEPSVGDSGTEVKETNAEGFDDGEYSLRNKELYDQQYIADNIIWWFRAYCKDAGGKKYSIIVIIKHKRSILIIIC